MSQNKITYATPPGQTASVHLDIHTHDLKPCNSSDDSNVTIYIFRNTEDILFPGTIVQKFEITDHDLDLPSQSVLETVTLHLTFTNATLIQEPVQFLAQHFEFLPRKLYVHIRLHAASCTSSNKNDIDVDILTDKEHTFGNSNIEKEFVVRYFAKSHPLKLIHLSIRVYIHVCRPTYLDLTL